MRNDHSIAGTTILQTTLEDVDNTQFFFFFFFFFFFISPVHLHYLDIHLHAPHLSPPHTTPDLTPVPPPHLA